MTEWNGFKRCVTAFSTNESGATAIEYAIVLAAVAGMTASVIYTIGNKVETVYFAKLVNLF